MPHPTDAPLLEALAQTGEQLLERHLATTKEWFPHKLVPWSRGRDFDGDQDWCPDDSTVSDAVRSALFVNTLTEDNLPYYFRDIERMFGREGAWGEWVRRWTAEEARHSIVLHQYLLVSRAIDPVVFERARMVQMSTGEVPEPETLIEGLAYVTLQELATRISHFNTGERLEDPVGKAIMRRVASDENLHFLFYRDAMSAAIEVDPSRAVVAIERQVKAFSMPGTGIPEFSRHSKAIADSGIYDIAIHHDQILQPVVIREWAVEELEGLSDEAEESRRKLLRQIERIGRVGRRMTERRAEAAASRSDPQPALA